MSIIAQMHIARESDVDLAQITVTGCSASFSTLVSLAEDALRIKIAEFKENGNLSMVVELEKQRLELITFNNLLYTANKEGMIIEDRILQNRKELEEEKHGRHISK